jgi:hypothetical protein
MPTLTLIPLDGLFAVCRLTADTPLPPWASVPGSDFISITRTAEELSIACRQEIVPDDVRCERGWRCLRVAGTLDSALVGVLVSLLGPLADAGIAGIAVSTFDTDYLLVKEGRWDAAIAALRRAGLSVSSA